MFLITLSSWFFYKSPLITSVKCFSCLTMVKIVSLIVLLFYYKASAVLSRNVMAGTGFNRAGKKIQWRSLQLMFYSLQCLWRLRAKFKKQGFARKPALLRGTESRQKTVGMADFCLPAGPNSGREALKVDKKRKNCFFFVYLTLQNRPARPRK